MKYLITILFSLFFLAKSQAQSLSSSDIWYKIINNPVLNFDSILIKKGFESEYGGLKKLGGLLYY